MCRYRCSQVCFGETALAGDQKSRRGACRMAGQTQLVELVRKQLLESEEPYHSVTTKTNVGKLQAAFLRGTTAAKPRTGRLRSSRRWLVTVCCSLQRCCSCCGRFRARGHQKRSTCKPTVQNVLGLLRMETSINGGYIEWSHHCPGRWTYCREAKH